MPRAQPWISSAALLVAGSTLGLAAELPAPSARHLIYLHGRIVQIEQSPRPEHPRFGPYELEKILEALRGRGFAVRGEIRPRSISVSDAADHVAGQVRELMDSGVPPDRIMIVGASMGGAIALAVSATVHDPALRVAVLGVCLSRAADRLATTAGGGLTGHILAIREASDELTASCPPWKDERNRSSSLVARELVIDTGLHHGFLFQPLPQWLDPVLAWAEESPAPTLRK